MQARDRFSQKYGPRSAGGSNNGSYSTGKQNNSMSLLGLQTRQSINNYPSSIKRHSTGEPFNSSYNTFYNASAMTQKYRNVPVKRLNHDYESQNWRIKREPITPVTVYVEPKQEWEVVIKNLNNLVENCATTVEDLRKELEGIETIKSKKDQDLKEVQGKFEVEQQNEKTKIARIDELLKKIVQVKSDREIAYRKTYPLLQKIMALQQALKDDAVSKKNLITAVYRN